MSYRVEEKIVLTPNERGKLQGELEARGLKMLHPTRQIHSIYFETQDLAMFRDSEEGVLPRKKIRLRRYPKDPHSNWALETKVSSIEGRFKSVSKPDADAVANIFEFGLLDRQYGVVQPRLTVDYRRQYFSLDGLRITFDSDIWYGTPHGNGRAHENWTVCELKAPFGVSPDEIFRSVDIPRRRFSKYCNGIAALIQVPGHAFPLRSAGLSNPPIFGRDLA